MRLLIVIAGLSSGVYGAAICKDAFKDSMDTIMKAIGTLPCMKKCIDPLINNFTTVWEMKDVTFHTANICNAYKEAADCLNKDTYCDMQKSFFKLTGSLHHRCEKQVKLYEGVGECINPYVDSISKKCDNTCNGRLSLINFANKKDVQDIAKYGGNALLLISHITPLCESFSCLISCIVEEFNAACANSGWLILDTLMQPLEAISSSVDNFGPALQSYIREKIEPKCRFVVDSAVQKKMRLGDFH